MIASCAPVNKSVSKSEIVKYNGKMPSSVTYSVMVSPSTRSFGNIDFVLNEKKISTKIFEMLSKSFVLTSTTTASLYPTGIHPDAQGTSDMENQNEGDLEKGISDYHFSISIGWDKTTLTDEFIDESFRPGIIAGSLGLFPVTFSDKIEMGISVTSRSDSSKDYHYEEFVTYVFWGPAVFTKMVMTKSVGNRLVIGSEKFIPKIEKMMSKFIKDISK
jgi:hypothetical protein